VIVGQRDSLPCLPTSSHSNLRRDRESRNILAKKPDLEYRYRVPPSLVTLDVSSSVSSVTSPVYTAIMRP